MTSSSASGGLVMERRAPRVGGEIDAWCTSCKLELNHIVVAIYEQRVRRVQCLTCGGQHNYSGAGSARASRADGRAREQRAARPEPAPAPAEPGRPYSPLQSYAEGEWLEHPMLGKGRVLEVRGAKIDVKFGVGRRTLLHKRPPAGWSLA